MKRRHSLLTIGIFVLVGEAAAMLPQTNASIHEKTLHLPDGSSVVYQAANIGGYSVAEEDILLGPAPNADTSIQSRGSGISITANRWDDGIVPFQFASNIDDSGIRSRIEQAIKHWNDRSSIRLIERNSSNADNYRDYLEFTKSNSCASYVGRQYGSQPIWVSEACSSGSMVHEIGHALGLLHEHTRNDRDQYILVNYDNIVAGKEHNFAIPTANGRDYGDYDYASIMHYGAYFFSNNGDPTISPLYDTTGTNMGQRNALSDGDIAAINSIYSTDLALKKVTSDIVGVRENFFIDLDIINQGEQGANEILIVSPMNSSNQLISFDGQGWECEQQASKVVCGRASLIEYSQTSLMLNFESGFDPPKSLKVNLSSRTADYDMSNNGDELEDTDAEEAHDEFFEESLQLGNAGSSPSSDSDDNESGGGGIVNLLNFFLLGLLVLIRKTR